MVLPDGLKDLPGWINEFGKTPGQGMPALEWYVAKLSALPWSNEGPR